ncbi:MAG TPA: hypothetical protein VGD64_12755 [Acidisarcina sp.]
MKVTTPDILHLTRLTILVRYQHTSATAPPTKRELLNPADATLQNQLRPFQLVAIDTIDGYAKHRATRRNNPPKGEQHAT